MNIPIELESGLHPLDTTVHFGVFRPVHDPEQTAASGPQDDKDPLPGKEHGDSMVPGYNTEDNVYQSRDGRQRTDNDGEDLAKS